jgi:hypothetical protein
VEAAAGEESDRAELRVQMPSFTFPDTPNERMFERISETAIAAEEAGFDSFSVMAGWMGRLSSGGGDTARVGLQALTSMKRDSTSTRRRTTMDPLRQLREARRCGR